MPESSQAPGLNQYWWTANVGFAEQNKMHSLICSTVQCFDKKLVAEDQQSFWGSWSGVGGAGQSKDLLQFAKNVRRLESVKGHKATVAKWELILTFGEEGDVKNFMRGLFSQDKLIQEFEFATQPTQNADLYTVVLRSAWGDNLVKEANLVDSLFSEVSVD